VALYEDIAEEIAERIAVRGARPGDQIEGELQLMEEFGVSRGTVVKALETLESWGLVRREQGKGTFVQGRAALHTTTTLASFSLHVRQEGRRPGGRVIEWRPTTHEADNPLHVRFPRGEELVEFTRVRTIDEVPVGVHRVATTLAIAERIGLLEALQSNEEFSFYALAEQAGIHVAGGEERYSAVLATAEFAEWLDLERPAALLVVERNTVDLNGSPFEAVQAHYVPGRYEIHAERRRRRLPKSVSATRKPTRLEER
jgi:GntR family transcriptional regulator